MYLTAGCRQEGERQGSERPGQQDWVFGEENHVTLGEPVCQETTGCGGLEDGDVSFERPRSSLSFGQVGFPTSRPSKRGTDTSGVFGEDREICEHVLSLALLDATDQLSG
ncbi:hypothetical protein BaRGS_00014874 [Batillaria attramentaria]|uniref:Uncharacterized protein n=1 Tax=Batillaria attramentaria TaxID=370345 RepID=A0ABD0L4M6_9CAEN